MFLYFILLSMIFLLFSRGNSVLSFFILIEMSFFFLLSAAGFLTSDMSFFWFLVLIVGVSVLILTILISALSFFGSDSQSIFLD